MYKFMQSKYFKPFTVFLTAVILSFTILPGFTKASNYDGDFDENEKMKEDMISLLEDSFEVTEMIKFTDQEVIYKTIENGESFLYEEHIDGDIVTTEKYKVSKFNKELIENFSTTTVLNNDVISVTLVDLLTSDVISKVTEDALLHEVDMEDDLVLMGASNNTWVKARATGLNYAYYQNSNGGGKAREITNEKAVKSFDKKFDTFTRDVDQLRTFERGVLFDLVGVGLLDKGFKMVKNPTVASVTAFLKKYLKSIPGVSVIVAVVNYFKLTNKTIASYKAIPGKEYSWRF